MTLLLQFLDDMFNGELVEGVTEAADPQAALEVSPLDGVIDGECNQPYSAFTPPLKIK